MKDTNLKPKTSTQYGSKKFSTLIVGLGNPEKKYLLTPHNLGWMVVDALAQICQVQLQKNKSFLSQTVCLENQSVVLMQPLTYMNLSGQAVREAMDYYQFTLNQLLVIHDDLDLPFLSMKFQKNRGPAGHNGLRNINQVLGSQNYTRLRIGVSKIKVLKTFSKIEQKKLPDFLSLCSEAVRYFLQTGLNPTANRYNSSSN